MPLGDDVGANRWTGPLAVAGRTRITRKQGRIHYMKLIKAVVQPTRVDHVRDALAEVGVSGMTLSEVRGFGRQKGHTEVYRGTEYAVDFVPKVVFEVVVDDAQAEATAEAIIAGAKTGKIGDGKVFVTTAEQSVRIRTGETGSQSLSLEQ
jgi:nitrogen regulatory protein PII